MNKQQEEAAKKKAQAEQEAIAAEKAKQEKLGKEDLSFLEEEDKKLPPDLIALYQKHPELYVSYKEKDKAFNKEYDQLTKGIDTLNKIEKQRLENLKSQMELLSIETVETESIAKRKKAIMDQLTQPSVIQTQIDEMTNRVNKIFTGEALKESTQPANKVGKSQVILNGVEFDEQELNILMNDPKRLQDSLNNLYTEAQGGNEQSRQEYEALSSAFNKQVEGKFLETLQQDNQIPVEETDQTQSIGITPPSQVGSDNIVQNTFNSIKSGIKNMLMGEPEKFVSNSSSELKSAVGKLIAQKRGA